VEAAAHNGLVVDVQTLEQSVVQTDLPTPAINDDQW